MGDSAGLQLWHRGVGPQWPAQSAARAGVSPIEMAAMLAAPPTKTVRRIFLRDIFRAARSVIWLTRASKLEPSCLHAIAHPPSQSAPAAGAAASRSFSCCGAVAVIGMDSPAGGEANRPG